MASAYIRSKGAGYENVFQVDSCQEIATSNMSMVLIQLTSWAFHHIYLFAK